MVKILTLNAGSSSHKSCLYNLENPLPEAPPRPLWQGQIDWLSESPSGKAPANSQTARITVRSTDRSSQSDSLGKPRYRQATTETLTLASRAEILAALSRRLHQGEHAVLSGLSEIDAVGHRVVHGGQDYQASVVITPTVKTNIRQLIPLAPSHNSANLEGIELMERLLGEVPQVAVFDTAFHRTMPLVAATYPGPYDWLDQGIRRYGFHGISHRYCAQRAAQLLHPEPLKLVICHLGNGSSLSAVQAGRSLDTTMGFTPLEGLMMGSRCGSVDPGILLHLMRQGMAVEALDELLNQKSGLKGISGVSHDLREIDAAIARGNKRAQLAFDLYIHRLKACLGAMLMSLGGVDALVFTAGIGEHSAKVRAAACEAMAFLGLQLDTAANRAVAGEDCEISAEGSAIRAWVIHTQEDWAIAQDCYQLLKASAHQR